MYSFIKYDVVDRVGYITLNRPEKKNALSPDLVAELKDAFNTLNNPESEAKVAVLRAAGDVFCAGADLAYVQKLQSNTFEENLADSNHLKELFLLIYRHRLPVIAMVQGHAIAGGCGLASVCDFIYSVPEARFGYSEVRIGFIPAMVLVFLLRKMGETRAKELLLGGKLIDAETASRYNLINFISEEDKIEEEVATFATRLCTQNSLSSMTMTKELISRVQDLALDASLDLAAEMNAKARETDDCRRGIEAFLEKTSVSW